MIKNYRSMVRFCAYMFFLSSSAAHSSRVVHYVKNEYATCDHDTYTITATDNSKCIDGINPWSATLSGSYDPSNPVSQVLELNSGFFTDCGWHNSYQEFKVQSEQNPQKAGFFLYEYGFGDLYADPHDDPYGIVHIPLSFYNDQTIYIGVEDQHRKCEYKNICVRDVGIDKADHFGLFWDNTYFDDVASVDFYINGKFVRHLESEDINGITVGDFKPGEKLIFMVKWIMGGSGTYISSNELVIQIPPLWDEKKEYDAGAKVQYKGLVYCAVDATPEGALPTINWKHCQFFGCN